MVRSWSPPAATTSSEPRHFELGLCARDSGHERSVIVRLEGVRSQFSLVSDMFPGTARAPPMLRRAWLVPWWSPAEEHVHELTRGRHTLDSRGLRLGSMVIRSEIRETHEPRHCARAAALEIRGQGPDAESGDTSESGLVSGPEG